MPQEIRDDQADQAESIIMTDDERSQLDWYQSLSPTDKLNVKEFLRTHAGN